MNEIVLRENSSIRIVQMDTLTTNTSFYHVDRIATMNVMIYVLAGSIYVTEDEIDYTVNEGEILFLRKGTHQYGKRLIREGTSWIYAHFQIEQDMTDNEDANRRGEITLPKYMGLYGHAEILNRLVAICEQYSAGKMMSCVRASLGLHEFFLDLDELVNIRMTNSLVVDVDSFIKGNIKRDISSDEFERIFHVTYKYLNRLYKNFYGRSIMQSHFQERMKYAAGALRTTNKAINVISEELGFLDPLYFSKCFKKYAGMSPREYRKFVINNF